jgi:hypothetical protein
VRLTPGYLGSPLVNGGRGVSQSYLLLGPLGPVDNAPHRQHSASVISKCGPWQAKDKYQVAFHRVMNHTSFLHFILVIGQLLHNSTPSGRSQPLASEFGSGPLMSKLPLFLQSRNLKSTSKAKMGFAEMFQSVS